MNTPLYLKASLIACAVLALSAAQAQNEPKGKCIATAKARFGEG